MGLYWYVMPFDALTIIEHRGTQHGVNSMHSEKIIAPKCGGNLEIEDPARRGGCPPHVSTKR